MILLDATDLAASRPGRQLFADVSLTMSSGDRLGLVGINGTGNMHVGAPFGGVGISGFGREGGREGVMEFVSTKTVLIG